MFKQLLLLCSHSHNDVPPEPKQNVFMAEVRGAVRTSIVKQFVKGSSFMQELVTLDPSESSDFASSFELCGHRSDLLISPRSPYANACYAKPVKNSDNTCNYI